MIVSFMCDRNSVLRNRLCKKFLQSDTRLRDEKSVHKKAKKNLSLNG